MQHHEHHQIVHTTQAWLDIQLSKLKIRQNIALRMHTGPPTNTIKCSTLQTLRLHVTRACTPIKRTQRHSKALHMASFQNECTAKHSSQSACTCTPNNGTKQHSKTQHIASSQIACRAHVHTKQVQRMCTPSRNDCVKLLIHAQARLNKT